MKDRKSIKAAIVGCGPAGNSYHASWYAKHPDVNLVGFCDLSLERAQECSRRYGGNVYTDYSKMLDKEKPDVVSICSPVHLHCEHTVTAAEKGCNVLCEKPMAPTLEECDRMIQSAIKNKVKLMLGFNRRYSAGAVKIHQLLKDGKIGRPMFVRAHWMCFRPGFLKTRGGIISGGGIFQDVGSHFIDLLILWFGEIKSVQGEIDINYDDMQVEDQSVGIFKFKNGTTGIIEASWVGPRPSRFGHAEEIYIYGTEGAIHLAMPPYSEHEPLELMRVWSAKTMKWSVIPLYKKGTAADDICSKTHSYKLEIREFINAVRRKGHSMIATGEDGKKTIEAILAVYQSWYTGKRVKLPVLKTPPLRNIFHKLKRSSKF